VDSEYGTGHYEESKRASNTARSLNIAGVVIGSILYFCGFIYVVVSVAIAASN